MTNEILEKVRKLLRLSKSSNPHEAALAAQRAQEIIDRYNIEQAMLDAEGATVATEEPIKNFRDDPLDVNMISGSWQMRLQRTIAKQNSCFVYRSSGNSVIVGSPSNVNAVRYLYSWLKKELEVLCVIEGIGHSKSWLNNFCIGATETVTERLLDARKQVVSQMRTEWQASGRDIVLVEKALAKVDQEMHRVRDYVSQNIRLHYGPVGPGGRVNNDARAAGRAAGHSVRMGRGAGALSAGALRLK